MNDKIIFKKKVGRWYIVIEINVVEMTAYLIFKLYNCISYSSILS